MTKYLRLAGCATLLAFLVQRMDFAPFARLSWSWWLLAVALYLVAQVVSSERWRTLASWTRPLASAVE